VADLEGLDKNCARCCIALLMFAHLPVCYGNVHNCGSIFFCDSGSRLNSQSLTSKRSNGGKNNYDSLIVNYKSKVRLTIAMHTIFPFHKSAYLADQITPPRH
jgi:hypothetical protein